MAAIFDFNGSERLGRGINLYQGGGRLSKIVLESRERTITLQAHTAQRGESWESVFYQVTFTSTSRRQPNNRSKAPAVFKPYFVYSYS